MTSKKKSQIFVNDISSNILLNLLDKVNCEKKDINNQIIYTINIYTYKKIKYNNYTTDFINEIKKFYYKSKYFYLDRDINYRNFLTIVRQICNYNNILFDKKLIYDNNSYNIIYYIYINK